MYAGIQGACGEALDGKEDLGIRAWRTAGLCCEVAADVAESCTTVLCKAGLMGNALLPASNARPLLAALWRWEEREKLKGACGGASTGRSGRFSACGESGLRKHGPGAAQGPCTRLTDATSQLGASQEERVGVQGPQGF